MLRFRMRRIGWFLLQPRPGQTCRDFQKYNHIRFQSHKVCIIPSLISPHYINAVLREGAENVMPKVCICENQWENYALLTQLHISHFCNFLSVVFNRLMHDMYLCHSSALFGAFVALVKRIIRYFLLKFVDRFGYHVKSVPIFEQHDFQPFQQSCFPTPNYSLNGKINRHVVKKGQAKGKKCLHCVEMKSGHQLIFSWNFSMNMCEQLVQFPLLPLPSQHCPHPDLSSGSYCTWASLVVDTSFVLLLSLTLKSYKMPSRSASYLSWTLGCIDSYFVPHLCTVPSSAKFLALWPLCHRVLPLKSS